MDSVSSALSTDERPQAQVKFTGERIVPGQVAAALFREHEVRYQFAGDFVRGMDVVDVACGTGIGTDLLRRAGAKSCLGFDIDEGALTYAKTAYPDCRYIKSDATEMPVLGSSVDVVVSFETIEHLSDSAKFLEECNRVLRPGGILICSTPNWAISRWSGRNPFHFREFEADEFLRILKGLFDRVDGYAQHHRVYPLWPLRAVALRMLGNLGLRESVFRIFGKAPSPVTARTEFEPRPNGAVGQLKEYRGSWFIQPTFVIAVARKAAKA